MILLGEGGMSTRGLGWGQNVWQNDFTNFFFFLTWTVFPKIFSYVQENKREAICTKLGMHQCTGKGKYLGLPFLVGRSRRQILQYLKERVWKKVHGWKEKYLSQAGKKIVIKSVLQRVPHMQCPVLLSQRPSVMRSLL